MTEAVAKANYKWRVVDIVVAAIIAVASGVIFWGWDIVCSAPLALFEGVTPGFEGLLNGFWLFAVFAWKKWNIGTTILSGALAGVGCWAYYWATNPGWNGLRVTWYLVGSIISGVVIAGVVVWYLSRALAVTGALERFESGRGKARV